jgi:hypothetical protein
MKVFCASRCAAITTAIPIEAHSKAVWLRILES